MHPSMRTQRASLVIMGSATLIPELLESAGVLPHSYVFHDGMMTVVSQLAVLAEPSAMMFLTVTSVGLLFAEWWAAHKVVNALKEADERLCLHS